MTGIRNDIVRRIIDTLTFRKARVEGKGKPTTVTVVYPYGMTANAPVGSLAFSFPINCEESNRFAILDYSHIRPADLKEGEVIISNYLTTAKIKFSANGDIEIMDCENLNITAAKNVNVKCEDFNIEGNLFVDGSAVEHNSTNIGDTHVHGGVTSGGSSTTGPG